MLHERCNKNLTIPRFDSREEAWGWFLAIENYFALKAIPDSMKLDAAKEAFTGTDRLWFLWWRYKNERATWWIFLKAFFEEFQPEIRLVVANEPTHDVDDVVEEAVEEADAETVNPTPALAQGLVMAKLSKIQDDDTIAVAEGSFEEFQPDIHLVMAKEQENGVDRKVEETKAEEIKAENTVEVAKAEVVAKTLEPDIFRAVGMVGEGTEFATPVEESTQET